SWWRGRKDWTGQGTTVALGPTSAARPIGPSTVHPSMPAGRWGHAGALPAPDSSRLRAHATRLLNAESDGTIGRLRTSVWRRSLAAIRETAATREPEALHWGLSPWEQIYQPSILVQIHLDRKST